VLLFGTLGAQLQLQLMLMLGRADEARDQLLDEGVITAKGRFGEFPLPAPTPAGVRLYRLPAYEWLRFCQAAATGDYDDAHEALRTILDQLAAGEVRFLAQMRRAVPLTVAAELGLRAHPAALVPREFARLERERATELLTELSFHRAARADLHTLAALLALEQGDPAAARPHLERAAALSRPGAGLGEESISRPLALAYLRRLRAARP